MVVRIRQDRLTINCIIELELRVGNDIRTFGGSPKDLKCTSITWTVIYGVEYIQLATASALMVAIGGMVDSLKGKVVRISGIRYTDSSASLAMNDANNEYPLGTAGAYRGRSILTLGG